MSFLRMTRRRILAFFTGQSTILTSLIAFKPAATATAGGDSSVGVPASGLYPRSDAEVAVGAIPLNYGYPEGSFLRYIASWSSGQADNARANSIALNTATNVCAYGKTVLRLPPGNILIGSTWDCTAKYVPPYGYPRNTNGGLTVVGTGKYSSTITFSAGIENTGVGWDQTGLAYGAFSDFNFVGGIGVTDCPLVTLLQGAANLNGAMIHSLNSSWARVGISGFGDYIWYNNGHEQQSFIDCSLISFRNHLYENSIPITFVASFCKPDLTSSIVTSYVPCQSMTEVHWWGANAYIGFHGSYGIRFHFSGSGSDRACADIRFDDYLQVLTPVATSTECITSGNRLEVAGKISGSILIGSTVAFGGKRLGKIVRQLSGTNGGGGIYELNISSNAAGSMSFGPGTPFRFMSDDSASNPAGTGLFNCGGERLVIEIAGGLGEVRVCDFSVALPKGIKFEGHTGTGTNVTADPFVFQPSSIPTLCWFDWDPNESGAWSGDHIVSCAGSANGISVRAPVPTNNLMRVVAPSRVDGYAGTTFAGQPNDYAQVQGTHITIGAAENHQFNRTRKVRAGSYVSGYSDWNEGVQTTPAVMTTTVSILNLPNFANLVVVTGADGAERFCDLLWVTSTSHAIIQSATQSGNPSTRNYSTVNASLMLAVASGSYAVQASCLGFGMQA